MALKINTKDDLLIAALGKLVSDDKARKHIKNLDPGEYEIDEFFHLCCTFKLSEPETKEYPHKARPWLLVALLAEELDARVVERIVKNHVHEPEKSAKKLEETTKYRFKEILAALGETTEITANGKTKLDGNCDKLDDNDIVEASATIKATKAA